MNYLLCLLSSLIILCSCSSGNHPVRIYVEHPSPQTDFAIGQSARLFDGEELSRTSNQNDGDIIVFPDTTGVRLAEFAPEQAGTLEPEGYIITRSETLPGALILLSKDSRGAMYGILDITEKLAFGYTTEQIEEKIVNPFLKNRFIKYNLPWSSYRQGEALHLHYQTCRDTLYWESFLDMMAVNRFNTLSLWNLHPFTYMIKPERYPEASPFDDRELEEWKTFWKTVFRLAGERGIDTYIVNWNIFTSKPFAESHELDKYLLKGDFFGDAENSDLVEDYTRECVTQVINEYPGLTGIGITLGERMGGMTSAERRDWIDRTIIEGMRQADRKIKLLYRAPLSAGKSSRGTTSKSTEALTRSYLDTITASSETVISFKYNWSHGHSSDKLFIVHGGKLTDTYWNPVPENYSILWTIRNEDFFTTRWGQPDFVRGFLENNIAKYTTGCIVGSECYIPAFDYFSKDLQAKPFTYAFERQWLWYDVWGRLLYDCQAPDKLFTDQLNNRFGIDFGDRLLESWKDASDYYHLFNSFYKGTWDATTYAEAFTTLKRVEGQPDVSTIITMDLLGSRPVLDTTEYMNIADYVRSGGKESEGIISPPELARLLNNKAEGILVNLDFIRINHSVGLALDMELTDLELLATLEHFFAQRIEATEILAEHLLGKEELNKEEIDTHLAQSIAYWKEIILLKEKYNRETIPYMFNENLNYHAYFGSPGRRSEKLQGN